MKRKTQLIPIIPKNPYAFNNFSSCSFSCFVGRRSDAVHWHRGIEVEPGISSNPFLGMCNLYLGLAIVMRLNWIHKKNLCVRAMENEWTQNIEAKKKLHLTQHRTMKYQANLRPGIFMCFHVCLDVCASNPYYVYLFLFGGFFFLNCSLNQDRNHFTQSHIFGVRKTHNRLAHINALTLSVSACALYLRLVSSLQLSAARTVLVLVDRYVRLRSSGLRWGRRRKETEKKQRTQTSLNVTLKRMEWL